MSKGKSTDKRLLEILDMIDDKYIFEVAEDYEVIAVPGEYSPNKRRLYKAYAVAIAGAACVLLLAGILTYAINFYTGIGTYIFHRPGNFTDTATEEEERFMQEHCDFDSEYPDTYLGKYGDCYIKVTNPPFDGYYEYYVGGYTFYEIEGYETEVYYKSDRYTLQEAYDLGYLSEQDLSELYILNPICRKNFNIDIPSKPVELFKYKYLQIVYTYVKDEVDNSVKNIPTFSLYCYARSEDAYAVVLERGENDESISERINGIKFVYPENEQINVYYRGELFGLSDAFEKGLIDTDFLKEVHYQYNLNGSGLD